MLLNCGVGEDSWESLGLQGDSTSPFWRRSALGFLWKEWCYSWNSSTLATSWLIGKDSDAGRDWGQEEKGTTEDEMAGWYHWLDGRVWVNSGSWWWTRRPGVLQFMRSQRVGHDWATELNWTDSYVLQLDSHNISINSSFPLLYSDLQSHFPSIPVPLPNLFMSITTLLITSYWYAFDRNLCIFLAFLLVFLLCTFLVHVEDICIQYHYKAFIVLYTFYLLWWLLCVSQTCF